MVRLVLAVLLSLAAPALAQAPAPNETTPVIDPAQANDRVLVTGRRPDGLSIQEYTRNFVAEVADPVGSGGFGVARWDKRTRICVGVENLPADAANSSSTVFPKSRWMWACASRSPAASRISPSSSPPMAPP